MGFRHPAHMAHTNLPRAMYTQTYRAPCTHIYTQNTHNTHHAPLSHPSSLTRARALARCLSRLLFNSVTNAHIHTHRSLYPYNQPPLLSIIFHGSGIFTAVCRSVLQCVVVCCSIAATSPHRCQLPYITWLRSKTAQKKKNCNCCCS